MKDEYPPVWPLSQTTFVLVPGSDSMTQNIPLARLRPPVATPSIGVNEPLPGAEPSNRPTASRAMSPTVLMAPPAGA